VQQKQPWTTPHWSHKMGPVRQTHGSLTGGHRVHGLDVRECVLCKADQARHIFDENCSRMLTQPCDSNPIVYTLLDELKVERARLIESAKAKGFTDRDIDIMSGRPVIEKPKGYKHPEKD
jgi:hypothetical protein